MNVPSYRPNWLTRLGVSLSLIGMLIVGLTLTLVFFALFLAFSVVLGGWLCWRVRQLRRQQQEEYIETEYTVEAEYELLEGPKPRSEETRHERHHTR
jgi:hypothetical protein